MSEKKTWHVRYPESIAAEITIPVKSMPEMLQEVTAMYPQNIALSFYGQKMNYAELQKAVYGFAASLQKNGVQRGDRVAIMLPNCPHYVIAYYGILAAGAIVTQVNPMLVEREIEHIMNDSGAETLVVFDALYPRVKVVQGRTKVRNIVIVSLQPTEADFSPDKPFEGFLQEGNGQYTPVNIEPQQDIAVLQYTGCTTGRSKGAMLTHSNVLANVVQSYEFFKERTEIGGEKFLTVIPLFHVFGMTACMNFAIYTANESILLPRFDLEEVLNTIKNEQPSVFPGVPTMYVAITNHPRAEEFGIDSIETCNSGSAPMPVELLRDFERKTGAKILEGYGLSEASPVTHCNPPFSERKPGSVGIGFPSTDYKIVDLATGTEEVPNGELGGYYQGPANYERLLENA